MTDEHWGYILLAYGLTAATILIMAFRILLEHRRLAAELARLEKNGSGERGEAL
ncbi:hemagglutination activity protein [Methylosinus sp. R-45379]|jgi:heme exporter protein CcmD|uniref:heme exporter protein CcmD n=1 Tax=unclassified Methylosinus TaxID=2624500 RepID=UPI00047C4B12|nr:MULTISPECIES: heme exporter protein CcmD [unclassified Methylosinus]OAI29623.1 hemagglutination activity protein [Methylosinus sp. R-45379]TDX65836.1 heme exporter protein CcmD [Methylosinus sp. sav-2]